MSRKKIQRHVVQAIAKVILVLIALSLLVSVAGVLPIVAFALGYTVSPGGRQRLADRIAPAQPPAPAPKKKAASPKKPATTI